MRPVSQLPVEDALDLLVEWALYLEMEPSEKLRLPIVKHIEAIVVTVPRDLSSAIVEAFNTRIRLLTRRVGISLSRWLHRLSPPVVLVRHSRCLERPKALLSPNVRYAVRVSDADGGERPRYGVAVLDKAFDVLECLADSRGLTVAQLAIATGLTKASVYRLIMTLAHRGYVVRRYDQQAWVAGPALLALSRRFLAGSSLVSVARPVLARLHEELGETVNLAVIRRDTVQYVDMIESDHGLRMAARLGAIDSLHCTSLGKAYLAALDPEEARAALARVDRPKRTPHTIDTVGELLEELRITRERGYGFDDEENEVGARCVGVAITSGDGRPIAGISISAPAWRMPDDRLPRVALTLQEAAREIEERSGERRPDRLQATNHPNGVHD